MTKTKRKQDLSNKPGRRDFPKTATLAAGSIGSVVNNIRTFGERKENKFFLNYFVNYNFPSWYLVSAPIVTANWNADKEQRWIVPFGGGVGKVFKLGSPVVSLETLN